MFKFHIENLNNKSIHEFNLLIGGNSYARVIWINLLYTFNFLLACISTLSMNMSDIKLKFYLDPNNDGDQNP